MTINLFFMYKSFGGGTTTFTAHLYMSMKHAGLDPKILRVSAGGDGYVRPFSGYSEVVYRNISQEEAFDAVRSTPSIMTAPCNPKHLKFNPNIIPELINAGMRCVVHDPNELMIYEHCQYVHRPIVIRPTMLQFFPDAIFIPHPYLRSFSELPNSPRPIMAVSIARVTFVKRTEIILEANRLLPDELKIVLRGAENRLYTKHKLSRLYPEFEQGTTGFPMGWRGAPEECAQAKFAVDMTYFPDDGGGSQYSFMEAWDAGAVNIIPKDWLRYDGEMKHCKNCIAVDGARELADVILKGKEMDVSEIVAEGRNALVTTHHPIEVAGRYAEELQ